MFRYRTRSHTKTNLMIFLRPTVVRDSQRANAYSSERYDYILGEQALAKPVHDVILPDMASPSLPPRPLPPSVIEVKPEGKDKPVKPAGVGGK
jgi:general secretion pathway protein D